MSPTPRRSALLTMALGVLLAAPATAEPGEDVEALGTALVAGMEGYAAPSAGPHDLEPHLSTLLDMGSEAAAQTIWEACEASRELLVELDENQAFLRRRNKKLERKKLQGVKRNNPRAETAVEQHRRLIELSEKKIKIQGAQRERLAAMHEALLGAVERLHGGAVTTFLARKLRTVRNRRLRQAILSALIEDQAMHTVPLLIARLGTSDKDLRQDLLATLRAITGANPGEWKRQWSKWWAQEKKHAQKAAER